MATNNVPTQPGSPEILRAWADEIEREIAEIKSSILPLQQRLDAGRERLDLVQRLLHLSSPSAASTHKNAKAVAATPQPHALPGIEDRMEEILRANAKPMHIRDIRSSLIQMGVPLPGRGDEANIILRLRRGRDRFLRTERGTYGLVEWNLQEYSAAPQKKKVRRQRAANP